MREELQNAGTSVEVRTKEAIEVNLSPETSTDGQHNTHTQTSNQHTFLKMVRQTRSKMPVEIKRTHSHSQNRL